jgi:hypothetical protein
MEPSLPGPRSDGRRRLRHHGDGRDADCRSGIHGRAGPTDHARRREEVLPRGREGVIFFWLYKMTSIISQRAREVGMVTWNTSDIEHVTTCERLSRGVAIESS